MPELLRMPEVAANTTEAVVASWPVPVGAGFRAQDTIATVETAKAAVDVTAEHDGVLLATLVAEGTEVAIGTPIALLAGPDEQVTDIDAALKGLGSALPAPRVFASPLARRLAKETGLPVETITGTGPNKRITKRDVQAALTQQTPAAVTPFTDRPHTRMRREIAARLTESARNTPHYYLRGAARVDALMRLRAELNEGQATRVSLTDLIVKAVGQAHLRVPEMNVIWTPDAIREYSTVDIGIAVATDDGLVAPVLCGVDTMTITAVARASADLIDRARTNALRQQELTGGTITVTNLGGYGTPEFTAIINPPQSAILAVGAIQDEPMALDGELTVGAAMRFTLSVDHRPIDGVIAARWLREFLGLMANPVRILA
jgi:pyruvate dehydrogenase E2 component (dihydrolipoamide acetyltransferase)